MLTQSTGFNPMLNFYSGNDECSRQQQNFEAEIINTSSQNMPTTKKVVKNKSLRRTCSNVVEHKKNGMSCNLQCKHVPACISERFLQCVQCDAMFASMASLNRHRAFHSVMEKAFSCNYCSGYFRLVDDLIRHSAVHTIDQKATDEKNARHNSSQQVDLLDQQSNVLSSQTCSAVRLGLSVHDEQQRHAELECGKNNLVHIELVKQEIDSTCEDSSNDTITESISSPTSPIARSSLLRDEENCLVENEKHNNDVEQLLADGVDVKVELEVDNLLSAAAVADDMDRQLPITAVDPNSTGANGSSDDRSSSSLHGCEYCGRTFKHVHSLKRHSAIHSSRRPFYCRHCSKTFETLGDLERHELIHVARKPYVCMLCGASYRYLSRLEEHLRGHQQRPCNGKVPDGELVIPRESDGESSLPTNSGSRESNVTEQQQQQQRPSGTDETATSSHVCSLCGRSFSCNTSLRRHERIHAGGRLFSCHLCARTFKTEREMNRHKVRRHKVPVSKEYLDSAADEVSPAHVCSRCGRSFTCVTSLRRHERIHAGGRLFSCQRCARTFKTETEMNKHNLRRHQVQVLEQPCLDRADVVEDASPAPVCSLCGRSFTCVTSLRRHERIHAAGRLFSCQRCARTFKTETELDRHEAQRHRTHASQPLVDHLRDAKNSTFKCSLCGRQFSCLTSLRRHERIHARGRHFSCQHCSKTFKTGTDLDRHKVIHLAAGDKKPYKCPVCAKSFRHACVLEEHQRNHTGEKPLKCTDCNKSFRWFSNLRMHRRTRHHGNKKTKDSTKQTDENKTESSVERKTNDERLPSTPAFDCKQCLQTFDCLLSLKRHELVHSSADRPFVCQHCRRTFATDDELARHKQLHFSTKPYVCQDCGSSFAFAYRLDQHARIHSGVKPHSCDVCGKSFRWSSNLSHHKRTVHGSVQQAQQRENATNYPVDDLQQQQQQQTGDEKEQRSVGIVGNDSTTATTTTSASTTKTNSDIARRIMCQICGGMFRKMAALRLHMMIHTGERPHVCQLCGKTFRTANSMHRHRLTHVGDRPFVCQLCGRSFTTALTLSRHKLIHFNDRKYQCKECGKSFNQPTGLYLHKRQHSADKRFKCPQCDMAFNYQHCLSGHMRKHNSADDSQVKRRRRSRRVVDHSSDSHLNVDEPATSTSTTTTVRDGSVDLRRRGIVGTADPRDETFRETLTVHE